jgi:hypothetical protein
VVADAFIASRLGSGWSLVGRFLAARAPPGTAVTARHGRVQSACWAGKLFSSFHTYMTRPQPKC